MAEEKKYLDNEGLLYLKTVLKTKVDAKVSTKVDKDGNKVLSDNNFSSADKSKLDGIEANANNYTLPAATSSTIGGVKPGAGLEVLSDGTLNATGGGAADSVEWTNVQNKPTNIAGYGITDAKIENKKITLGTNSITVPSNNNELVNGAGYQTAANVTQAISNATQNFVTTEDLSEAVSDKVTTQQMNSAISTATQNLATRTQVTEAISTATTDMATKTYVNQQLANINKKQVVTSTEEMTDENTIYLLANEGTGNNIYDEYIVVDETPEKIGSTEVDLTNYVQKNDLVRITNREIDSAFADF